MQATFRRRAFIDYLYFTDYETTDPAAYPVSGFNYNDDTWAQTNCAMHWYDPGTRRTVRVDPRTTTAIAWTSTSSRAT